MTLADFGTGQVFLSMLWFFLFFIWIWLLIVGLRRHLPQPRPGRLGQGALGDLRDRPAVPRRVRLPDRARSQDERARAARPPQAQDAAQRAYIQSAAGTAPSTADEIARLADLKRQGVITDAEFEQAEGRRHWPDACLARH